MLRAARSVAALLVAALVMTSCGDDQAPWEEAADERAARARQAATEGGLDDDVADLVATLARSVEATYRITYRAVDASGTTSTVTVTQRPPARRIDVVAPDRPDLSTIVTADASFTCVAAEGEWRCAPGDAPTELGALVEADAVATSEALAASADDFALRITSRVVAGVDARCLEATATTRDAGGPAGRLCVAPEGPPLLVERASGTLAATSYTTDVDADAFDLPAEPGEPQGGPG